MAHSTFVTKASISLFEKLSKTIKTTVQNTNTFLPVLYHRILVQYVLHIKFTCRTETQAAWSEPARRWRL